MKIKLSLLATGLLYVPVVFAQKQPNVVIILADDMGYGDVGCNNPYARVRTPAIDQLARNGIRFTDAHSAGALSGPSTLRFSDRTLFFPYAEEVRVLGVLVSIYRTRAFDDRFLDA